jgi:hypothetical protein
LAEQPAFALVERAFGAAALDGRPRALGRLLDKRDLVRAPLARCRVVNR